MIQANELRINNWITILKDNGVYYYQIASGHDIEEIDGCPESVNPIPLTPEILLACGFEDDGGEFQHPKNTDFDLMICCSPNNLWCAYNFGFENVGPFMEHIPMQTVANAICNPFKYVHQLQNLYFALTGTELEIKL